tara:strand:+ start:796 stop:1782 length:987 start_codon:yes stop_codon:yes gene_type:complete
MEINNFSFFNTDNKCYRPKTELSNKEDLNKYIDDNFTIHNFPIKKNTNANESLVEECKLQALKENKGVFLISDLDFSEKQLKYNCLIPKVNKLCDNANMENLLQPLNDLINDLFGNKLEYRTNPNIEKEYSLNNITDDTKINTIPNCVSFTDNGKKDNFSKSGNFIIYKNELIDNQTFRDDLANIRPYIRYKNEYDTWSQQTTEVLKTFKRDFQVYICKPTNVTEGNLDLAILNLKTHYDTIFQSLNSLSSDISNLSVLTKYDTLYLEKLQNMVDDKKKELKNLIGFDGANNGKLSDTTFLKNLKISENIILFFAITFVIYAYAKKQI